MEVHTAADPPESLITMELVKHEALFSSHTPGLNRLSTMVRLFQLTGRTAAREVHLIENTKAEALDGSQLAIWQGRTEVDAVPLQHTQRCCYNYSITCSSQASVPWPQQPHCTSPSRALISLL